MRRVIASDESGAVAVMVGICLVVLIGFAAISVDVGGMYLERRELQNGADAAALAVAYDCANNPTSIECTEPGARPVAQTYANSNARDSLHSIPDPGGVVIDHTAQKVTVHTTTNDPTSNDPSRLRHWFAPVLGFDASEVVAAGAAIWGPIGPASINTIPITISACEWEKFQKTPYYPAGEPWDVATNGQPQIAYFHSQANPCELETGIVGDSPSGQQVPGGFGWLDTITGQCEADIVDGWMGSSTGNSSPQTCSPQWFEQNLLGKVVAIPVFDATNQLTGNNAEYRYAAYAAIYVTGYNLGSTQYRRSLPGFPLPCDPPNRCIAGWFTTTVAGGGEVDPTAPDTGVNTVQMVLP